MEYVDVLMSGVFLTCNQTLTGYLHKLPERS